jgi:hypothetical protein
MRVFVLFGSFATSALSGAGLVLSVENTNLLYDLIPLLLPVLTWSPAPSDTPIPPRP